MSGQFGAPQPYDETAQAAWQSAPALPAAPQFFGVTQQAPMQVQQVHQYTYPQQPHTVEYTPAPAPPPAPAPVASAWQPRYTPTAPAPASAFVPQLGRRDGVFGLAIGLFLIAIVFATALALQAKMPGYAPAASSRVSPAVATAAGGGGAAPAPTAAGAARVVGPVAPAAATTARAQGGVQRLEQ